MTLQIPSSSPRQAFLAKAKPVIKKASGSVDVEDPAKLKTESRDLAHEESRCYCSARTICLVAACTVIDGALLVALIAALSNN